MVTRRPLELNLIHTPELQTDIAEFPQLGFGKIADFAQVRLTLEQLNEAVSEAECISDNPIKLNIYSKNVPDLCLIDLPGYIQVHSLNQPPQLRSKIAKLCERYIESKNIILAVSAAVRHLKPIYEQTRLMQFRTSIWQTQRRSRRVVRWIPLAPGP